MNIIITTRKQHPVEDEALYELFQQSFQQWYDSGIDAAFLHHTFEEFQSFVKRAVVFLAIDADNEELLGMHCFSCYKKKRSAAGFYLAISPKAKHQGIATKLLECEKEQFLARGYRYLKGTTSVPAVWSVRWHLKNGYRIVGFGIGCKPYGDTYSFRLQLAPSLLWDGPLAPITAKCSYFVSRTAAYLTHRSSDGSLNWIGRMARRIMRKKLRVPNLHRYVYSELIK